MDNYDGDRDHTPSVTSHSWCDGNCNSSYVLKTPLVSWVVLSLETLSDSAIFRCGLWMFVIVGCVAAFRICTENSTARSGLQKNAEAIGAFLLGWVYLLWRWILLLSSD